MIQENSFHLQTPLPTQIGDTLYQTKLSQISDSQTLPAIFTNKMLIFKQKYLPFSFDIRFSTNQDELIFFKGQQEISFTIINQDHLKIRNTLKLFLNQKGFHQQFKAIKKIGQGSFASVYLVKKIQTGQEFAVKAFSKESAYSQENGKECLMKEIQIMRQLNHSNNMKLQEVFESDNSLYLIFELLNGGMLYEKIKAKKKFTPKAVRQIIRCILQGLREMHSKGIMHRDLKPQNILMRSQMDAVIADYGLAEFVQAEKYLFTRCGTPGYVAPEVINITDMSTKYGSVCDMFSLGLIFHVLLFGKSVFLGRTYNEVLKQNRTCNFNLQGEQYDNIPTETLDLLKKMLRTNPQERITSEQAIAHPYFKLDQLQEQIQKENMVSPLPQKAANKSPNLNILGESPILTTANTKRKQNKQLRNDSCIGFKMGRDTEFTGKTQTVGTLNSGKISGFGGQLIKGFDPSKLRSKFTKKQNAQTV